MTRTKWRWPPPPGQLEKMVAMVKSPEALAVLEGFLAQVRDDKHDWLLGFVEEVARTDPLFASRLFEKCNALRATLAPVPEPTGPWLVDDGNGLRHTAGYTVCKANGPALECPTVVALCIRVLNEFHLEGGEDLRANNLLLRAEELAGDDNRLGATLASIRRREGAGSRGYSPARKLVRRFRRAGVWMKLVHPNKDAKKKGSFRLELALPYA